MVKKLILCLIFFSFLSSVYPSSSELKEQASLYRKKGCQLQGSGDLRGALSYYLKSVQIDPYHKEAFNDLGVIYERMGDLDKAEQMYLKAIDIDEGYLGPYANLGFLYEKKNDFQKANHYWKRRYELGTPGEYWREKAREHLSRLGTYPLVRQEELEKEAALLSRELVYKREQEGLESLEEARLHFKLGFQAMTKGLYKEAKEEFQQVLDLDPPDEKLKLQTQNYYKTAKQSEITNTIKGYLENGLNYLKEKDYLSLMQELRKALMLFPEVPRD